MDIIFLCRPFVFTGEPSDTFQATIELTTEIARDEFDGIALIVARTVEQEQSSAGDSSQAPVMYEAICMDIGGGGGGGREAQVRGAIRTIFDVWSLRR